ncbi:MAG: methylated-DNA--[protein]-cysteine S-methyltransferase [Actinobacteria bacterium]|uniref:methylated-DNA--[protein]-cysteine S-methyltransferase n=1 Tax=freshwater metagenome TaxID=449393 RepID=A0A6J7G130_9ZZZZ|nr:methylated-DNA--[protein]-cysteine S-methyltransferase [Actinomycetota bacterium]
MTNDTASRIIASPVGPIHLNEQGGALTLVRLIGSQSAKVDLGGDSTATLRQAERQLDEYFRGRRRTFDLTLRPQGTPFQRAVWNALAQIDFGTTRSYGDIARSLGQPSAARAIGGAVGANPLAIVVPCHRVLAGNGRLTGFSGGDGIPTKVSLLTLEGIEFRP